MKINRLFEILYILIDKKTVPAGFLAEHFEVSIRTIYRDIDILASSGIPIYTKKGKNGGIYILENFVFDKSLVSEREQNDILSGLQSLKAVKYPEIDQMLDKFASLFNKQNINWIEIDFSYWGSEENEKEQFTLLKNAILNKNCISFDYYNSYSQRNTRVIEPLKIIFKSKNWYIYGYCKLKDDFRLFKLKRIVDLKVLNIKFNRELCDKNLNISKHDVNNQIKIILKIDSAMSYRVFDEFHPNDITKNPDNSFTVVISYPEDEWLYGYILSFGSNAEVMEPVRIREIIKLKLQKSLNKYL